MSNIVLEIKSLTKKNIYEDINFQATSSSINLILSTTSNKNLFKIILNLLKKDNGEILLFNHNQKKELNKAIQFIGYSSSLKFKNPKMSIIKYLTYSNSFYKANYLDNINYYINLFKLNPDKLLKDLSLEELKIVSIINSIFFDPKIILLDEPYFNLTEQSIYILSTILLELKRNDACIIISSNNLNNLSIIDKAYLLDNNINQIEIEKLKLYTRLIIYDCDEDFKIDDSEIITSDKNKNVYTLIYKGKINNILKKINNSQEIKVSKPFVHEIINDLITKEVSNE